MSVYVVSYKCIDNVVECIAPPYANLTTLGRELLALNYLAFDTQYGKVSVPDSIYFYSPTASDTMQKYKAIQSYLYQVMDLEPDHGTRAYELIARCKEALALLAGEIIADLPDYNEAAWG